MMPENFKNEGQYHFFGENRLVFIKPRDSRGNRTERSEVPGKKSPKTPQEILTQTTTMLERLKADPFAPREGQAPNTHTNTRVHTREATPPKPYYKKSVEAAERAVKLSGRREARETLLMQGVHENLYRQYMNPGFMMHLRVQPGGLPEKIYPALDLIMKYPDAFEYNSQGGNILHIVKKRPYNKQPSAIADNFLVVMEGGEGDISRVRSNNFDADLKSNGRLPWVSNAEFANNLGLYNKMWTSEHVKYLHGGEYQKWATSGRPPEGWSKIFRGSFEKIDPAMKEIYVAMNIDFPQRFVDLVASRGLAFEQNDPRVKDVIERQKTQGKTYEEITRDGYGSMGKFKISVLADPELPGVFQIYTLNYTRNPLRVSAEGYVLRQDENGVWATDPRYTDGVRRNYYYRENGGKNKDLLTADTELPADDRKRMEDAEKESDDKSPTAERVRRMYELIEKREKVDKALYAETVLAKLHEVTMYLLPANQQADYYYNYVKSVDDPLWHKDGAKRILDSDVLKFDETRNNGVARILGVTF